MSQLLLSDTTGFPARTIAPMEELAAYEAIWAQEKTTTKRCADLFRANPSALPSDLVDRSERTRMSDWLRRHYEQAGIGRFGVAVHRAGDYPAKLRDARNPVEVLAYQGAFNWVESPCVAVVGTRKPSDAGVRRTRKLVRMLAAEGFTIVSGLATGIDTVAHQTALDLGAPTIAVIGTPLTHAYPRENAALQATLSQQFLVLTQVPSYRYSMQDYRLNRAWFPERNATMSALTIATIIVEAGETSGTLTQARAALHQGRELFVLESAFKTSGLKWPHTLEKKGAIRLADEDQLRDALCPPERQASVWSLFAE